MRTVTIGLGTALLAALSPFAQAAYPTRVLTAVEKDHALPELHLSVGYDRAAKRAKITREWVQDVNGNKTALDVRELKFEETVQRLLFDLRVGLYRDLEFHMNAPIVLKDKSAISYEQDVEGRSTIFNSMNADDPSTSYRYPLTEVPASRERAGFGDMTFGLAWSPFVDKKDEAYPTVTIRADIIAPTGKRRDTIDQSALGGKDTRGTVGLGQTIFDLSIGLSRRMAYRAPTFDPYMLFGAEIPVATSAQRQLGMEPPPTGRFLVGAELIVHESKPTFQHYAVDLSFGLKYIGIGRTYSELSDYLPNFDQRRVPANRNDPTIGPDVVGYTDYANPSNYANNLDGAKCGTLDNVPCGELNRVDEHMEVEGSLALNIQPAQYLFVRIGAALGFVTDHLLTSEKVGTDTDPANLSDSALCDGAPCKGRVNARNSQGEDERSPYYDPRYDAPGRRLRIEEITNFKFFVSGIITF